MAKEIEKEIEKILTSINKFFSDDLFAKKESEFEDYWHFKWNETATTAWNTYQFFSMLELYKSFCRRWEEHHNGSCCVVERVRDKYLIPKIKSFVDVIKATTPEISRSREAAIGFSDFVYARHGRELMG